jgi:hypothetical protein
MVVQKCIIFHYRPIFNPLSARPRFTNSMSCFEPGPQEPYRDISLKLPVVYVAKCNFFCAAIIF